MKTATAASAIPHPMAIGSFVVSAIALILVVGGTFAPGSPFTVHPDALDRKPFALVIGLCYILPIFMGIGGSLFAGQAMNLGGVVEFLPDGAGGPRSSEGLEAGT